MLPVCSLTVCGVYARSLVSTGTTADSMLLEVVVAVVVVVVSLRTWYVYTSGRCTSTRSMAGKTVIITGGTAGIGKETARDLLWRSARVVLACRNLEKGARVAGELRAEVGSVGEVVVRRLDTSDLTSVRTFAKEVLDTEKAIHVLINNAGRASPEKREVTEDGLEMTMATNHFGHFLLTNLLLGRLKESAPSRVVNVSSMGHRWASKFDVNDLTLSSPYDPPQAYFISKLCNVLFTRELADRLAGTGVTANSLHPGAVNTNILNSLSFSFTSALFSLFLIVFGKDAALGAQTSIHLAVSEEVEGLTGIYFGDCKEEVPSKLARRKDLATALWEASVKAVGLQPHETHC
ncbi:retinol dehydrogenase 12-like [Eriocheir sinensis]|uniref:retinol dehydrogenase 12-like n=1 Tax=Eriocheir sinensis TaxID=95602 RepID=UPI0021C56C43|nr:retinol dehydrogenase 12-like [Eriocheir sinensis]